MPPDRTLRISQYRFSNVPEAAARRNESRAKTDQVNPTVVALDPGLRAVDFAQCDDVYYPTERAARKAFRTKEGKSITAHQWAIYDIVRKIPAGKVTTYKNICLCLGQGSPRSVGSALRKNPFAPFIPCHRIVASDMYIGGFFGEWGPKSGTGKNVRRKQEMLEGEGIRFNEKGFILDGETSVWRGNETEQK